MGKRILTVGLTAVIFGLAFATLAFTGCEQPGGAPSSSPENVPVTGIILNKTELTLTVGDSEPLTPTVAPENATNKAVDWSSSNTEIATADNGEVVAVAPGEVTITVTTADGGKTAQCAVTVNPVGTILVTGVTLNKTTLKLTAGESETLTATVAPEDAANKNVSWSSDNEAVATVYNNGHVTAIAPGEATITVTTADGNKTAQCAVTVSPVPVTEVTFNETEITMTEGNVEVLTATVEPENATNKAISWSSSNTAVAAVENGLVTAVAPGTATITVTTADGGKTATCIFTINARPPDYVSVTGVTLNKNTLTLTVGSSEKLTTTIAPENATTKHISWSSSDAAVAAVDNNGTVTAHAGGNATITATTQDGGKTAQCTVTVPFIVTDVTLNKTSLTLTFGGSETLTATVLPAAAENKSISWSSSNTAVATVSNSGTVIAVAPGNATITVTTAEGNKTAQCAVTVALPPATVLTANTWANGNIANGTREQWFRFTATGTSHNIHFEPGSLSDVNRQLYDSNGATMGNQVRITGSFLATSLTADNVYYIRITPYNSSNYGEYKIAFGMIIPPTVTELPPDRWVDGALPSTYREQWFKFTAIGSSQFSTQYFHFEPGTLNSVYIQLYTGTGSTVTGGQTQLSGTTLYNSRQSLARNTVYYIRVTPYAANTSGTYKIGLTYESYIRPGITELAAGTWAEGNITDTGGEWFKFIATAENQYIHFDPGTQSSAGVQLYTNVGAEAGTSASLSSNSVLSISRPVTVGNVYYIKVTGGGGAYKIAFNTSFGPPGATVLDDNVWADGTIATAGGVRWYKFTAATATQYIHLDPNTLNSVTLQLYTTAGSTAGTTTRTILYNSGLYTAWSGLTIGNEYYLKVRPYNSDATGACRIGVNTLFVSPSNTVTTLAADTWANGNIPASTGEQWFGFTATAAIQWIHFEQGSLNIVDVQLYDSTGATRGSQTNNLPVSRTGLTIGSKYYIKVTPYGGRDGEYRIGFSALIVPPDANLTALTPGIWNNGNITVSGEAQWFKFYPMVLMDMIQHIYFEPGTLDSVKLQVYTNTGSNVGDSENLNSSNHYINRPVVIDTDFYIKVTTIFNGSSGSYPTGTYRIGIIDDNRRQHPAEITSVITAPNTWAEGTITPAYALGGTLVPASEEWFEFTATAATQYIHFESDDINDVNVSLYNRNTGRYRGMHIIDSHSYSSWTGLSELTVGHNYCMSVDGRTKSGTFRIAFSDSSTTPP